ncbi:MAG: hypothetical protein KF901_34455 [Myxococcales bacterium]|nr:hypothetical protein [Myxococcales bacterium]
MPMWVWSLLFFVVAVVAAPGLLRLLHARAPRAGLDFNIIDDAIHHLDTEDEPWTVFMEVRVAGAIDEAKLRGAVRAAMGRHAMARAYQRRWRPWQTVYEWGVVEEVAIDPVRVADVVHDARASFLSTRVPLDEAPPFRIVLVRAPDGDRVLLCFNHAASDGVGTLRFLTSIARAYSGQSDEVDPVEDRAMRDLARNTEPRTWLERWRRLAMLRRAFLDAVVAPPARIAAVHGEDAPGFGCARRVVPSDVVASKPSGATVNDLLLGALHVAIQRWNAGHALETARIGTMMPVNVRPKERWNEAVGNIVYFVSISTSVEERADLASTVGVIAKQTREVKEQGTAAALREVLFASPTLLVEVKRKLPVLLPLGGERFIDTAVLSNVGRVDAPLVFGELGPATELWFSPPCRMPLGLAVGASTYEGRLFLTFRYRHALWNEEAAEQFADLYLSVLESS